MAFPAFYVERLKGKIGLVRDYAWLLGGAGGRLVLSLAYFVSVANTLSVGDFGLFATASAAGVVIARVSGLGFVSPLYRAATVRHRLIGTYTAGLIAAFLASIPLVAVASWLFYVVFFDGQMPVIAFVAIILAEALFWRASEVVMIVNNGLGRFGRAAILSIGAAAIRAGAAVAFASLGSGTLKEWALIYLGANAMAAVLSFAAFYPRQRLRFSLRLTLARWKDSASVAAAEVVFYLQSDLDKMLVLWLAGAQTAGLYAILLRLIDLTAMPIRSANTMIVQKLMRVPRWLASIKMRVGLEAAVAVVSVAEIVVIGAILHVFPTLLGSNVSQAAPFVLLAFLVPVFRNLVEYQSELLYACGRTTSRAGILAIVGLSKAFLLAMLLHAAEDPHRWIAGLNGVFAVLWLISAAATYTILNAEQEKGVGTGVRFWRKRTEGRDLSSAPQPGE